MLLSSIYTDFQVFLVSSISKKLYYVDKDFLFKLVWVGMMRVFSSHFLITVMQVWPLEVI